MNIKEAIERISKIYCRQLEKVLNNMDAKQDLTVEELYKITDCIRVLGNIAVLQKREDI